jgi:hypothetical protein
MCASVGVVVVGGYLVVSDRHDGSLYTRANSPTAYCTVPE